MKVSIPMHTDYELTVDEQGEVSVSNSPAYKEVSREHIPLGNSRRHEKAIFKPNGVEHNVEYLYNPPVVPKSVAKDKLQAVVMEIAKRLKLDRSLAQSCHVYSNSTKEIAFAFVAFNIDESLVLKMIPLFDKLMMSSGWDKLQLSLVKLDASVTRINFVIRHTYKTPGHKTVNDEPYTKPDIHNVLLHKPVVHTPPPSPGAMPHIKDDDELPGDDFLRELGIDL